MFASKDSLLTRPSGGYNIARSVRLRSSATAYFNRTLTTPTNNKIWTWSSWVKRGTLGSAQILLSSDVGTSNTTWLEFGFDAADTFTITAYATDSNTTSAVFRDPSAWYHIIVAFDSTQATAANRCKIYVNGVQQTLTGSGFTLNAGYGINSAQATAIGFRNWTPSGRYFDGYLTEINFVDGQQLTPSSFGSTNAITGVWQPAKYTGTYGNNGFYLNFSDNSAVTTSSNVGIGKDFSGNGNYWTSNSINVTAYSGTPPNNVNYDSMTDVPTLTSATAANYCVMNPLDTQNTSSVAQGNQYISFSAVNYGHSRATMSIPDGSYWEVAAGGTDYLMLGVANSTAFSSFNWAGSWAIYQSDGKVYNNGAAITGVLATFTTNDVIGFAVKGNKLYIAKNNTWLNSGNPVAQTGSVASSLSSEIFPYIGNGGGAAGTPSAYFNAGQRPFSYTPPTGYVALNTYNLPTSTITNGAAYMNAVARSGTGATATVAIAFQPDWIWSKCRTNAVDNLLQDSNRGYANTLFSNLSLAEDTTNSYAITTSSTGYGFNGTNGINGSGRTYVDWVWKAGGTAVTNNDGSVASQVSVGATQGFSVVTFTAPSSGNFSAGHGLGVTPSMVITKVRGRNTTWITWHNRLNSGSPATTYYVELNTTGGQSTFANTWGSTGVTSSVIGMGIGASCAASDTIVAYCFSAVAGYSAFGSYDGNNVADGSFVYLGFRPRFIMIKSTSASTEWVMIDTARSSYNLSETALYANRDYTESTIGTVDDVDILSNGFKLRNNTGFVNASQTYIYAAFAENPFKYALAR